LRPEQIREKSTVELKLGIKSSLPNVKSALALIYSLWKSNNKKTELVFCNEVSGKLLLKDEYKQSLKNYFQDDLTSTGTTESIFEENYTNKNAVLTSQIEALKVAFELIWRIAIVRFEDDSKPFSAERTGGVRFAKKLLFTKNVDIIDLVVQSNEREYKKILFNWLTEIDTSFNADLEKELIRAFTIISEEAVYRLRIDDKNDIKFINAGIYEKFEDGTEKIDVVDYKENMGSLRILQNLLKENLNYFLSREGKFASLKDITKLEELKEYTQRVNYYLDLTNINIEVIINEQSDSDEEKIEEDKINDIYGTNIIYYGAPGTGKSHTLEEISNDFDYVERVTFYPEYTHDDFIGSFMPSMTFDKKQLGEYVSLDEAEMKLPGKPMPYYTYISGPFTSALVQALNNPDKSVLLIVEELNRANAAAVFGEFFQLLDRKNNGESKYSISVSNEYSEYLSSQVETYFKGDKVTIPTNFTICATMNSADQGVNPLDSAFKRRWNFIYVPIDFSKAKHRDYEIEYANKKVTWEVFATTINEQLKRREINEDKHLGQYFITETEITNPYKFASKILLYLFDDVLKFNRRGFFKSEYKTFSDLLNAFIDGKEIFEFEFAYVSQGSGIKHDNTDGSEVAMDTEVSSKVSELNEIKYSEQLENEDMTKVAEE
jgi:hypothetical protein